MAQGGARIGGRWLVLAGGSASAAHAHAQTLGADPLVVLERHDVARNPLAARRLARSGEVDGILISSADTSRQIAPQLLSLAAATIPQLPVLEADRRTGSTTRPSRAELLVRAALLPAEITAGLARAVRESDRMLAAGANPAGCVSAAGGDAVIAVWHGEAEASVGGSITHISGILSGFRAAGLKIGLVSDAPPPTQLGAAIDELELIAPLRRSARLTPLHEGICVNGPLRRAGAALAKRLSPAFVYQRHRAYLLAGQMLAHDLGRPHVLEFNAAEAWHKSQWFRRIPGEELLAPLLRAIEIRAVAQSAVVAAVSEPAAEMAASLGATPDQLAIVPNGVDAEQIIAIADRGPSPTRRGAQIGWIGSFGPWHGAEILIRALRRLSEDVSLVMVGDGPQRRQCQVLADQLGLSSRVNFRGTLPHHEAVASMASCDVLAAPHTPIQGIRFFGSPTKLFEYMAIGRPIVASALEQMGEVLEDGRTAVLVRPGDVDSLAAGLTRVVAMPDRGRTLGQAARTAALQTHTWSARAEMILERLESLQRLERLQPRSLPVAS